jgi:hypothetical protein
LYSSISSHCFFFGSTRSRRESFTVVGGAACICARPLAGAGDEGGEGDIGESGPALPAESNVVDNGSNIGGPEMCERSMGD